MRVVAKLMSEEYSMVSLCSLTPHLFSPAHRKGVITELLVISLSVSRGRVETGEVEHNGAVGPVCAVGRVVRYLSQKIEVGFSELDIDTTAVCRSHCTCR